MSSKYTVQISQANPLNTVSISRWKVEGALHKPNGMTTNSYKPEWVAKAVFSIDPGAIFTCQYPDLRSNVEKYRECESMSIESSILGRGNTSILVTAFNLQ